MVGPIGQDRMDDNLSPVSSTAPSVPIREGEVEKDGVSSLSKHPIPIKKIGEPSQPALNPPKPFEPSSSLPNAPIDPLSQRLIDQLGDASELVNLTNLLGKVTPNKGATATERTNENVNINQSALTNSIGQTKDLIALLSKLLDEGALKTQEEEVPQARKATGQQSQPSFLEGAGDKRQPSGTKRSLLSFLNMMGEALSRMEAEQAKMAQDLSKVSVEFGKAQKTSLAAQQKMQMAGTEKMVEGAKLATTLRILSPIITGVLTVASIATLGAATPLTVIAFTLMTTALTTGITIADSATGVISKGMDKFLRELIPGDSPGDEAKRGALVMAVMVLMILLVRGGSTKLATARASAEAERAMEKAGKQLALSTIEKEELKAAQQHAIQQGVRQASAMTVITLGMLSGGVGKLWDGALKSLMGSSTEQAVTSAIMQAATVIAIVVGCVFTRKATTPPTLPGILAQLSSSTLQRVQDITKGLTASTQVGTAGVNWVKGDITKQQKCFEGASQLLRDSSTALKEAAKPDAIKKFNEAVQTLMQLFADMQQKELEMASALSRAG